MEVSIIEAEVRDDDLAGINIYMLTKSDQLLPAMQIAYQNWDTV
jgi:hypothetical protein